MFKKLLGIFLGMAVFGMASTAQATLIDVNFSISSSGLRGSIDGMFSGDTGTDNVLEDGEVSSFMVIYTSANPKLSDFSLTFPPDTLSSFIYHVITDDWAFILTRGSAFLEYDYDADEIYISDGGGDFLSGSGVRHRITAKVPEPSTILLFGVGLIALIGIGWRRQRIEGFNSS